MQRTGNTPKKEAFKCKLCLQQQQTEWWFKGNTGETSKRRGRAHMGFPECVDTTLSWTELNRTSDRQCAPLTKYPNFPPFLLILSLFTPQPREGIQEGDVPLQRHFGELWVWPGDVVVQRIHGNHLHQSTAQGPGSGLGHGGQQQGGGEGGQPLRARVDGGGGGGRRGGRGVNCRGLAASPDHLQQGLLVSQHPLLKTHNGLVQRPLLKTHSRLVQRPLLKTHNGLVRHWFIKTHNGLVQHPLLKTLKGPVQHPLLKTLKGPVQHPLLKTLKGPVQHPILKTLKGPVQHPLLKTRNRLVQHWFLKTCNGLVQHPLLKTHKRLVQQSLLKTQVCFFFFFIFSSFWGWVGWVGLGGGVLFYLKSSHIGDN